MDQRIRMWALTRVPDGMGGSTEAQEIVADVDAALQPASAGERQEAQRLDVTFDHWLYLEPGVEVARVDRFALISRPDETYRVIEVMEPAYQGHHLEVKAIRENNAPSMPQEES